MMSISFPQLDFKDRETNGVRVMRAIHELLPRGDMPSKDSAELSMRYFWTGELDGEPGED